MIDPGLFAAVAVTLYVGHHLGDYWVQTDHQARHKGDAGPVGRWACFRHVFSYVLTQHAVYLLAGAVLGLPGRYLLTIYPALLLSGVTHWMADRREHGLMFWLARRIPGKAAFLQLGKPRIPSRVHFHGMTGEDGKTAVIELTDNPQLATGAWALDQAWHIFFGVFLPALLVVSL